MDFKEMLDEELKKSSSSQPQLTEEEKKKLKEALERELQFKNFVTKAAILYKARKK